MPRSRGIYTGTYVFGMNVDASPNTDPPRYRAGIREFARLTGKAPAFTQVNGTTRMGEFILPTRMIRTVWRLGTLPVITISPMSTWDTSKPDPKFSMQKFIDGVFDDELQRYATQVRNSGVPVMIGFGGEVNAGWAWSGASEGAGRTDGYGDPTWPDGPERYRDAHRHVVDIFREVGANNVTWVFHATPMGAIPTDWTNAKWYYPGDEYIDWVASGAWGWLPPYFPIWTPLSTGIDLTVEQYAQIGTSRPLVILDAGVAEFPGRPERKAHWIRTGLDRIARGRWRNLHGFGWWNEPPSEYEPGKGVMDMRINSTAKTLRAWRAGMARKRFVSSPQFRCADQSAVRA